MKNKIIIVGTMLSALTYSSDSSSVLFANNTRQILTTNQKFEAESLNLINNLGSEKLNFSLLRDYHEVYSRNNLKEYNSNLSGIISNLNLGNNVYSTLGYAYTDIDYKKDGEGTIQTFHLGLTKLLKIQNFDVKLGINTNYNFHENKRNINKDSKKLNSSFNSYTIKTSSEISKTIQEENHYIKPYLGLGLAYINTESFTESKGYNVKSQDNKSVVPKIGVLIGDTFYGLKVYTGLEYSYEMGNVNNSKKFINDDSKKKYELPIDNMECGNGVIKAGASYEVSNFNWNINIGKVLTSRSSGFANISLEYKL